MMGRVFSFAFLTAIASAGLCFIAHAQPRESCLAFEDALNLAAGNDPGVVIARANLQDAEADLEEARSLRRPQLSTFSRVGVGDRGLVDSQIENQIGVRASQRLLDFGDARLARRAAEEDVTAQQSLIIDAENQAELAAGRAYIEWLEASEQLSVTSERIDYFTRQLDAIEALLDQGGSTRIERAEVAAELATAEAFRFEFEYLKDQAAAKLAIATGERSEPCKITGRLIDPVYDAFDPDLVEKMVQDALKANPQIEALRRTRSGLTIAAEREARNRLPAVDLVGIASYGSQDFQGDFDLETRLGIDISVPILSGRALDARRKRSQAQASRARGDLFSAERELRETVEILHRRSLLLEAQSVRRDTVLTLRNEEFDAALLEHQTGYRTLPDLVDVRIELEQASLAAVSSKYELERVRLQLNIMTGTHGIMR